MKNVAVCALLLLSAACAHVLPELAPAVRQKASFELNCPAAQLTVTELQKGNEVHTFGVDASSGTFGASGCGKRASYEASCMNGGGITDRCSAIQSSAVIVETPAAPAAAPAAAAQ